MFRYIISMNLTTKMKFENIELDYTLLELSSSSMLIDLTDTFSSDLEFRLLTKTIIMSNSEEFVELADNLFNELK